MKQLRVVLAEDNLFVREGLMTLLASSNVVEVCRAVGSLPELLEAVDECAPDVVLTDIRMPPGQSDEGVRAAQSLRASHPDVGVVVISQFAEPAYALAVLDGGSRGRGYVLKDRIDDLSRLLDAISSVAAGGSYIDDEVVDALIRSRSRSARSPLELLTEREREVLAEIATGRTNAGVAAALGVSEQAVEKHTGAIFAKLGLSDDQQVNRRVKAVLVYLSGRTQDPA